MEWPEVLSQQSILTAAVQLPFEKAGLLGKTTQGKPTLATKAISAPISTLHSPGLRDIPKSSFTSCCSEPAVPHTAKAKGLSTNQESPKYLILSQ